MIRRLMVGMLAIAASDEAQAQRPARADSQTVLFVCEHGTVKSVIAMAYFERLARSRGLPYRAISRGVAPDSALPPFMREGLRKDGLDVVAFSPTALSDQDVTTATIVVSFDQPGVTRRVPATTPLETWDGLPSVSASYQAGSAAIERRVRALVDSLGGARDRTGRRTPRNAARPSPDQTR